MAFRPTTPALWDQAVWDRFVWDFIVFTVPYAPAALPAGSAVTGSFVD